MQQVLQETWIAISSLGATYTEQEMTLHTAPHCSWWLYLSCYQHVPTSMLDNASLLCTNSVAVVRKRTIPTERPPLVGEVSANLCG
jgi:hypothetical protein